MPRHLSEILLIQIVATYLVILGHSYPFVSPLPEWLIQTQIFIYCFHMPLFVWISGYLLIYTGQSVRNTAQAFIKKRFIKLLVPYFILSIAAIVPKYILQPYLNDSVSLDLYSALRIFLVPRENVWGHFWFLPMIFLLGIIGLIVDKILTSLHRPKLGWKIILVLSFILYCLCFKRPICPWLSIDDMVGFGWIFVLGIICAYYNVLERFKKSFLRPVCAFAMAIIIFLCNRSAIIPLYLTNAAIAVLMIYSLTGICSYFTLKIKVSRNAVYAQTFTIFLLSWPCQAIINVIMERILHCPYYIIMPLQFSAGVLVPMLIILAIKKIETRYNVRWISFCLGK